MARFTENDIRPDHLNWDKEAAYDRDVARLHRHLPDFTPGDCPACGVSARRELWTKLRLHYHECQSCGTIYISPRPTPAALNDYYSHSEVYAYWEKHIFPASEAVRRKLIFEPRYARIRELCDRHGVDRDCLIEVGPGFGTFCRVALDDGGFRRVLAIEPTPPLAQSCRDRGIEVIEKPIEEVDLGAHPASVVASFEVIEHLLDPGGYVRACANSLTPGGLLVLTCPNGKGFDVQVLGPIADTFDTEHLNYFNPESIAHLVSSAGLEVLEVTTPGELDAEIVRNKVLAGKFSLEAQPFLQTVLLDRWEELKEPFQAFIRDNRLSSHMWLVARKP